MVQYPTIKAIVLDQNNQWTGEMIELNTNHIYSPQCLCGQSQFMCRVINPLCNLYICENDLNCPSYGQYQVVPKKHDHGKTPCRFCGGSLKAQKN